MGAGASVAHELALPAIHNNLHHVGKNVGGVKPRGGQYGEMLVHLRLVSVPRVRRDSVRTLTAVCTGRLFIKYDLIAYSSRPLASQKTRTLRNIPSLLWCSCPSPFPSMPPARFGLVSCEKRAFEGCIYLE